MHIPSQFKKTQEWNLEKQAEIQKENPLEGRRILMVEHDDIKYHYILNKKEFEKFEEQHKQMRVDVKVGSTFIAPIMQKNYLLTQMEKGLRN